MSQKYILAMENSYTTGSIFNPLLGFYSNLNPNDLYIMHGSILTFYTDIIEYIEC